MNKNSINSIINNQDQTSDKVLLELIAQEDKQAFSLLMDRYLNSVIVFVMRYFSQRSDAEDIAQETFIRLWCKAPVWQDKGISVKAWLFKVAYNHSIDQLRKHKLEYNYVGDKCIVDESAFIERQMSIEADLSMQQKVLADLPERQRTAIMLCAVKGFSNIEAAVVLGISVDALESLLARGRRKLRTNFRLASERINNVNKEIANDIC